MPRATVQHQGIYPNDLLFVSPQFVRILIKDQDVTRLSIEWLRKKDGSCDRKLCTEAEAMGNDKVGKKRESRKGNDGRAAFGRLEMSSAQGQSTVKIF